MTKESRAQMLNQLIEQVTKEMNYCTSQIEMPAILRCNCIVATSDAEYQITVNEETHKAEVIVGNYGEPCRFTESMATKVASDVKASNGWGPLTFIVWGWKDFYKARRNNLQQHLDAFNEVMERL